MPMCCAFNCNNKQGAGSAKSFHLFPFSQPEVLKQWIINVRRKDWMPNKRTVICSDHFDDSCFDKTGQTVRLRSGAIPTIFSFSHEMIEDETSKPSDYKSKKMTEVATQSDRELLETASGHHDLQLISDDDHNYYGKPFKLRKTSIARSLSDS